MFKTIVEIRERVYELGKNIDAPLDLLNVPDKSAGDGSPHLEVKGDIYHYVASERGNEIFRKETTDSDELLYWIFSDVTTSMAYSYELKHRRPNQDFRRLAFSKRIELLEKLNPKWADREAKEIEKSLMDSPFDDDADLRVALYEDFISKGLSDEDAYKKACLKYPLP